MAKAKNESVQRTSSVHSELETLYSDIRQILVQAREQVYRAANVAMVEAYWQIGRVIVEQEQKGEVRAEYGSYLIQSLSQQLTHEFGKGFNTSSLKRMRQFYIVFPKGAAVRHSLSWTHDRIHIKTNNKAARALNREKALLDRILCATKSKKMEQYTLLKDSEQIFASEYRLYLPSEEELGAYLAETAQRLHQAQRWQEDV